MSAVALAYPKSITTALHAVMSKIGYVQKQGRNEFHKYNYAGEGDLLAVLRPVMVEEGLLLIPSGQVLSPVDEFGNIFATVDYTLAHKDGDVWPEKITVFGAGNDKSSKGGVGDKGVYKALTGANKYLLFKLFQIETGDDPEVVSNHDKDGDRPTATPPANANAGKAAAPLKTASWLIKADGPKDFIEKFVGKCSKAPTLDAIAKLEADNATHIKALSDKEYEPIKVSISMRTTELSKMPAAPVQQAAE